MATKLVQMYSHCDDLASARKLFDKMPHRNVFAWTAMLAFYSRHGMPRECLSVYGAMRMRGDVAPDNYIFPKVFRACAQSSCLHAGLLVHKDLIASGATLSLEVWNSLIDMYSKCEDVGRARRAFEVMAQRDVSTWNSMMSVYVWNGLPSLALELLGSMRMGGFEPDAVTWNTLMDAYCRMGCCHEARKIFEQMKEPGVIAFTTLISGYSRVGNHEAALEVFRGIMNRGVSLPDLDSLSSVLVSCWHLQALSNGQEVHAYGIKTDSGFGLSSFYDSAGAALVRMYAKCGRILYARGVFGLMNQCSVVTWNAMISGFVDLKDGHGALECLREMRRIGVEINHITISAALPICDLKSGKEVHAYMRRNSLEDLIALGWNALIHMYSKCGCIGAAYSVFSNMVAPDLVSWNTMIHGLGMHGLGVAAIELLQEMVSSGLRPDQVTFTSILSACSHSGLVDEGLKLFKTMTEDHGVAPKMEHFACVVDMLARAGRLEDAVQFVKGMPMEADKSIWGTLLAASRDQQSVVVGKLSAECLFRLEPEHAGNYVTLASIYANAGRWDDAVGVRKLMEGRGLVKPSGCSCIESRN